MAPQRRHHLHPHLPFTYWTDSARVRMLIHQCLQQRPLVCLHSARMCMSIINMWMAVAVVMVWMGRPSRCQCVPPPLPLLPELPLVPCHVASAGLRLQLSPHCQHQHDRMQQVHSSRPIRILSCPLSSTSPVITTIKPTTQTCMAAPTRVNSMRNREWMLNRSMLHPTTCIDHCHMLANRGSFVDLMRS